MIPDCPPPDAPQELFELVEPGAPLVLELRSVDEPLLRRLEALRLPVTLVLTVEEAEQASDAAMRGHELALDLDPGLDPEQLADWPMEAWWELGRTQRKAFRRASGVKPETLRVPTITRQGEQAMAAMGVRTVLVDGPGRAHLALKADGTRSDTLVLPRGEYLCGQLEGWALDRVAEASEGALELGLPAVRVVVDGQDTEVLLDWLDRGWLRQQGQVVRADAVPHALPDPKARPTLVGRRVDRADLMVVAEILSEGGRLPREVSGFTLTEAFLGFCLLLTEELEEVVLVPLKPPASLATSTRPRAVHADDVRAAAVRLAPSLTQAVPGFVNVGEQTLTAAEFLVAMARVLLGEERVDIPGVESPDPFAPGLGWGESG